MTDYDSDTQDSTDYDHTSHDDLHTLYWDKGLSQSEMSEVLDVSKGGVQYWMNKLNVDRKTAAQASADSCRVNKANFKTNNQGYEIWRSRENGKEIAVGVHRLLAIAEGADPYRIFSTDVHAHHANGVKWDNRPENVHAKDARKHIGDHNRGERMADSKLTPGDIREIRRLLDEDLSQSDIGDIFGVDQSLISRIKTGCYWSHIE